MSFRFRRIPTVFLARGFHSSRLARAFTVLRDPSGLIAPSLKVAKVALNLEVKLRKSL
jgi:hypothetical protein